MAKPHDALRVFGLQLRQVREDAGLTGRAVADRTGWPHSKVSKLERGQQTATVSDVDAWVQATGAGSDDADRLQGALRKARTEYTEWRQRLSTGTRARQLQRRDAEAEATLIRAFEPGVLPGLLQTADYARAVFQGLVSTYQISDDVEEGVRARLSRQELLLQPGRRYHFVLAETALYCRIADSATMRAQLERLLAVARIPAVDLAVVPLGARWPVGPLNGFWIFDRDYALVETLGAELTLREPDEIAVYERIFETFSRLAVRGSAVSDLILGATRRYAG
ncbi:helix-turn-helix domain-containing protein [Cryptosporangium arvum]|uniref:helix-turn-helix domain-containing protein n=1 Tax=Cryptosporangium arvum TaxID=80871 RepID=UPI0004ACF4D4|nr:helix-turn-helix transcriptional regulator [Cryptosporangium arvum]